MGAKRSRQQRELQVRRCRGRNPASRSPPRHSAAGSSETLAPRRVTEEPLGTGQCVPSPSRSPQSPSLGSRNGQSRAASRLQPHSECFAWQALRWAVDSPAADGIWARGLCVCPRRLWRFVPESGAGEGPVQKVEEFLLELPSQTQRPGQGRARSLGAGPPTPSAELLPGPPSFPGGEEAKPRQRKPGSEPSLGNSVTRGLNLPLSFSRRPVPGNLGVGRASPREGHLLVERKELRQGPASSSREGS